MNLLILSDGKKGHENQSVGLAEALLRRHEGHLHLSNIWEQQDLPRFLPDAIISAGNRTQPFLLQAARRYQCPSILIMKPSLFPSALFTHCLIPEHDIRNHRRLPKNTIATKGALNRLPESIPPKEEKGLIMLGGPCKHFDWQPAPIFDAIQSLTDTQPDLQWTIGDSRRTPESTLTDLAKILPTTITLASHQTTSQNWLVEQFLQSKVAWITPDSTSMLFEALTAGCRLGTLPLPARNTRLARAHRLLADDHWLTPYQSLSDNMTPTAPPSQLHETGRCADLLLERLVS